MLTNGVTTMFKEMIAVKYSVIEWVYSSRQTGEFEPDVWGTPLAIPVRRETARARFVRESFVMEHNPRKPAPLDIEELEEPIMHTYIGTSRITGQTMQVKAESFSAAVKRIHQLTSWCNMNVVRRGI